MYFDVGMPLTLFFVTLTAVFLDEKVEGKLKGAFEERKFNVRDALLLVAAMSVTVFVIVFIPQMALVMIFLLSYSMVLFIFTYFFSDLQKRGAKLFCMTFLAVTLLAATISLFSFRTNTMIAYGALALFGLSGFSSIALLYEEVRVRTGSRWYLAVLPPALFICLYLFFSRTRIWFPYLLDFYGIVFAVLVILYLGSLFTWKSTLIFVGVMTVMDTILVLYTGTTVSAVSHIEGLRLPVLIYLPIVPTIATDMGIYYTGLGLGDFVFAGLIGTQALKKFGKNFALSSAIAMSVSFFVFQALMFNYGLTAFPGTLMIVCGWLPVVLFKSLKKMTAG
jgi:hypothetical protein